MLTPDNDSLGFQTETRKAFSFLTDLGYTQVESSPTLIRYRKDPIEVDIYHGRQSYEIGIGISRLGVRYGLSALIRITDATFADRYRYPTATTKEGVVMGIEQVSSLMRCYGLRALTGDPVVFSELDQKRKSWSEDYAMDVLAEQIRPKAEEAFRRGDYATASELYARIQPRLSPAELKKLALAEKRRYS